MTSPLDELPGHARIPVMKLGVIGCGKMGSALVAGAIRSKSLEASQVLGFDPFPAAATAFAEATGASVHQDLAELVDCQAFLLCTKPHHATTALKQLKDAGTRDALLISIAAGLPISSLEQHSPDGFRIIRCMPNTPALIGKGAAAYSRSSSASEADASFTASLLSSVGLAVELPENLLDAVTGLSGSGPAFVFLIIEALADGGVRNGLPRPQALQLAAQTVLGAASMVLETGQHPAVLKDMVTSPGGTTIAGLASLEHNGLRSALIEAVTSATHRATELGKS